jgi:hypothetical protein
VGARAEVVMAGTSWSVWLCLKDVIGVAGDGEEKIDLSEARNGDLEYNTFD